MCELATSPASASPSDVLDDHGRRSRGEARAAEERARACDEIPGFDDALATGAVSAGHLDAIARATKNLPAEAKAPVAELASALIGHAATESVRDFDPRCQNLSRRLTDQRGAQARLAKQRAQSNARSWVDKNSGMWRLHAELDPERGAKLADALQTQLDTVQQRDGNTGIDIDRLRADALCELVTLTAGEMDKGVPEVHVHIDWRTLSTGEHAHSLCEQSELCGRVLLAK